MTTDNAQIETALARLFDDEQQRIVFWNDPEREFFTTLPFVYLPEGVTVLKLDEIGALEAKVTLERGATWSTRPAKNPNTTTIGCWTSGCTAAVSEQTRPRSSWINWAW